MTDHSETAKRIIAHIDKTWYEAPVGEWENMIVEALERVRVEALDEAAQTAERQVDGYEPGDRGADGALSVASELRRLAKYAPRDPLRDALREIAMMNHARATDAEKLEACRRVALRALEGKP